MKFLLCLAIQVIFFSGLQKLHAQPLTKDLGEAGKYFFEGSYKQFTKNTTLPILAVGGLSSAISFHNDDDWLRKSSGKYNSSFRKTISDSTFIFSFPIIPLAGYGLGRSWGDSKLISFSKEYLATLYLALLESGLISMIPIHDRPDSSSLKPWEKNFRFVSSFPSGHIIPFATLGFKVLQYYGPLPSLIPFALTGVVGVERVRSRKHYVSDVVGGIILSWLASEGIAASANYDQNSAFYKLIFDANFGFDIKTEDDLVELFIGFKI